MAATWGIKLGTQPYGSVLDPSPIAVGDVRWFRVGDGRPGKLHKRAARGCERVKVSRIPYEGYLLVDYY
jgi:hypothetical protein